jgi:hypothetical protein
VKDGELAESSSEPIGQLNSGDEWNDAVDKRDLAETFNIFWHISPMVSARL